MREIPNAPRFLAALSRPKLPSRARSRPAGENFSEALFELPSLAPWPHTPGPQPDRASRAGMQWRTDPALLRDGNAIARYGQVHNAREQIAERFSKRHDRRFRPARTWTAGRERRRGKSEILHRRDGIFARSRPGLDWDRCLSWDQVMRLKASSKGTRRPPDCTRARRRGCTRFQYDKIMPVRFIFNYESVTVRSCRERAAMHPHIPAART